MRLRCAEACADEPYVAIFHGLTWRDDPGD